MSSSAQPAASVPKEEKEKKGLGKMLSRVKTVLKRGEGSSTKRQSLLASKTTPATQTETAKKRYVRQNEIIAVLLIAPSTGAQLRRNGPRNGVATITPMAT